MASIKSVAKNDYKWNTIANVIFKCDLTIDNKEIIIHFYFEDDFYGGVNSGTNFTTEVRQILERLSINVLKEILHDENVKVKVWIRRL